MTRTLQNRFVITAMAAVTLLLIVLLGVLNAANAWYSERETDKLLNMLSGGEAAMHHRVPPRGDERRLFSPPPTEDARMSAVYFTARESSDGFDIDLSRISSVSEDAAAELVKRAANSSGDSGTISGFKYKLSRSPIDGKRTYVFLDTASQRYTVLRVIALSCLAGLAAWLLMFLLVIILSRRAILPIAKNIEKQKQFVTDAGHEIKTPLAIILANTEAMELHGGESKWSRNIKAQVSRLDGLMKDLLMLAKSDEADTDIPRESINLSLLLSDCADMFCEPAALRGITLSRGIAPELSITSNKEYLTRIISVLLDNAVKYAKPEGEISVSAYKTEKHTEIRIKNSCSSLPSCEPEKLFDRFYREDAARTQKSGGYGIGLSAARAIANTLGAQVTAKYEGADSIVFTIRI